MADLMQNKIQDGFPLEQIVRPLLDWYGENARDLPWRENTDPYRVWVSEIMLQQTRVEAAKPYFLRFMDRLPTVQALACVSEEELMKLWEGLGYYSRAKNLQKAAKMICDRFGGVFPTHHEDILSLPGIGPYTAGAIASIAFESASPAVDGNVLRVISRLTNDHRDMNTPAVKNEITARLRAVYPETRRGHFTQSLMELGAVVCIPGGVPKCDVCPLAFCCLAREAGTQQSLPLRTEKPPRKVQRLTVFLLRCGDMVAIRKRGQGGLLGGLWEFPNAEGSLSEEAAQQLLRQWGLTVTSLSAGPEKHHVFTHVEWCMGCFIADCASTDGDFVWVTASALAQDIAMPAAFRKFSPLL